MSEYRIEYSASPTLMKFHQSDAFVRGVRGPIGSGKSVGMCFELFRRAQEQAPDQNGVRKVRGAVIRNTNPQLETTTIKTWLDWFKEEHFGRFSWRVPYCHNIKYGPLEDGTTIEAEVYFLALDRPDDVKKLLSLELTFVWINEAREVPLDIVLAAIDRVGRYPSMRGGGPTWYGVIMDTNPPDDDHWWAAYEGHVPLPDGWTLPENWAFYVQPPAAFEEKVGNRITFRINPDAENLKNLVGTYYKNLIGGKPVGHVRVYVCNRFGTTSAGKPVYEGEWNQDVHLSDEVLQYTPGCVLHVGLDFGNTPSAVFSQRTPRGQWQDVHELVCKGVGAERFATLLKTEVASVFSNVPSGNFRFWGDPAGESALQGQERSYFDILKASGIPVHAPPGLRNNNPMIRREAGAASLNRMVDGQPGYIVSPTCKHLIKGFNGGYHYRRLNSSGVVKFADVAEKNEYSHPHEARQYGLIGGGEVKELLKKSQNSDGKPKKAKIGFKVI